MAALPPPGWLPPPFVRDTEVFGDSVSRTYCSPHCLRSPRGPALEGSAEFERKRILRIIASAKKQVVSTQWLIKQINSR